MLGSPVQDHDQVDPAEALMREVGAQLREVRLERGEDLDDVAQYLRIKSSYLFGIEQGDLSMIPGRTYALGFLRSYADYLGFDGEDLIARIKSTVDELTHRTQLSIPTPLPESRLPKVPVVVLSLAIVAGIYAGWSYLNYSGHLAIETVADVPDNLRELARGALGDGGGSTPTPSAPAVVDRAVPREGDRPPGVAEQPAAQPADGGASAPLPTTPDAGVERDAPAASTVALEEEPAAVAQGDDPGARPASGTGEPDPSDEAAVALRDGDADTSGGVERPKPQVTSAGVLPGAGPGARSADAARSAEDDTVAPLPAETAAPSAVEGLPVGTATAAVEVAATALADGEAGRSVVEAAPGEAPDEVLASALDPTASGPEGAPQVYEAINSDARVVLRARGSSWIQISSPSGDYLRTRTLQPGDVFMVPNRSDLELWTGNAGGFEVVVDGTVIPPLGTDGAVVRGVSLDPAHLLARPAQ